MEILKCKNCGARIAAKVMLRERKCPRCHVAIKCYYCKVCRQKYAYDYQGPPCPRGHNDWKWGC